MLINFSIFLYCKNMHNKLFYNYYKILKKL